MTLITDNKTLKQYCKIIKNNGYIAIDTEFLRDRTYFPKLCLMQIASEDISFAIDPIDGDIDFSPVIEIFKNKKIVKVFHSGRQDIEIIYNMANIIPDPVFDTQIAAMVCGYGNSVSYANLAHELAGVEIDKTYQFTDWSKRPLKPQMVEYALSDVIYLCTIYKKIKDKLENEQRILWVSEEIEQLVDIANYDTDSKKAWKRIKYKSDCNKFIGILKDLAIWRENLAKKINKPRNHIMKDTVLTAIADIQPKNSKQFNSITGINRLNQNYLDEIIEIIKNSIPVDDDEIINPPYSATTADNKPLISLFKILLAIKAKEHNVVEKLIASNDEIVDFVINNNKKLPFLKGWRYEIFGKYAISLKKGNLSLSINDNNVLVKS